jgi:hypothetical protein
LDSLPPAPPPPPALYADAPGDIYPRDARERELCAKASQPDWLYLGGLLVIDGFAFWQGVNPAIKYSTSLPVRFLGPMLIGVSWGATIGGGWLALPKCNPEWVAESPVEGRVRSHWPLTLSLALLAGVTAPIVNQIAWGNCNDPHGCIQGLPASWTTFEREMRIVFTGLAGFGGALLPYLIPPRTWSAWRELEKIRFGMEAGGGYVAYTVTF